MTGVQTCALPICKRPAMQRYQAATGHAPHRPPDSEETDATPARQGDPAAPTPDTDGPVRSPQEERQAPSEVPVPERRGCVDGGMGKDGGKEAGSNCGEARASETNSPGDDANGRKGSAGRPPSAKEGGRGKEKSRNDRHHPEPVGAAFSLPSG